MVRRVIQKGLVRLGLKIFRYYDSKPDEFLGICRSEVCAWLSVRKYICSCCCCFLAFILCLICLVCLFVSTLKCERVYDRVYCMVFVTAIELFYLEREASGIQLHPSTSLGAAISKRFLALVQR